MFYFSYTLALLLVSILLVNPIPAYGRRHRYGGGGPKLNFIGEARFPTGLRFGDTEVGGLSALEYGPLTNRYFALSDDRSEFNDARYYFLTIDFKRDRLTRSGIKLTDVITLLDKDGKPFKKDTVDPEGLRYSLTSSTFYFSSEGIAEDLIPPFVRESILDGRFTREFRLPGKFRPTKDGKSGVRSNKALESLTFNSDRSKLHTATESALAQDGPIATFENGALARILEYDRASGKPRREFVYEISPISGRKPKGDGSADNGLVEMLAVTDMKFIMVERAFVEGVGNNIKLFLADISGATDVSRFYSVKGKKYRPTSKRLLFDLGKLGIKLDNVESITFGPKLRDGSKTLALVSDNNFNKEEQFAQLLALKVKGCVR